MSVVALRHTTEAGRLYSGATETISLTTMRGKGMISKEGISQLFSDCAQILAPDAPIGGRPNFSADQQTGKMICIR